MLVCFGYRTTSWRVIGAKCHGFSGHRKEAGLAVVICFASLYYSSDASRMSPAQRRSRSKTTGLNIQLPKEVTGEAFRP